MNKIAIVISSIIVSALMAHAVSANNSTLTSSSLDSYQSFKMENSKDLVTLTKNSGLAMVRKNGQLILATLNGRYLVTGNFTLKDAITGKDISSLDIARDNQNFFSPEQTPMMNEQTYTSIGKGKNIIYVILNPLIQRKELSDLIDRFNKNPKLNSFYQVRLVFLGKNDSEMGYGAALNCDLLKNIKSNGIQKRSDMCRAGLKKSGGMYMVGMMYDFDKLQNEFPIVIKDGKLHKKADLGNYIN